jgi:hypothetical protein
LNFNLLFIPRVEDMSENNKGLIESVYPKSKNVGIGHYGRPLIVQKQGNIGDNGTYIKNKNIIFGDPCGKVIQRMKGRMEMLRSAYRKNVGEPEEVAEMRSFINKNSSGYIFLIGPSGSGKTYFLSKIFLEFEKDCVYHENSKNSGITGAGDMAISLYFQLENINGDEKFPKEVTPSSTITNIINSYMKVKGRERLIVIIDSVEDCDEWKITNPLMIPDLGEVEGTVYFILSGRCKYDLCTEGKNALEVPVHNQICSKLSCSRLYNKISKERRNVEVISVLVVGDRPMTIDAISYFVEMDPYEVRCALEECKYYLSKNKDKKTKKNVFSIWDRCMSDFLVEEEWIDIGKVSSRMINKLVPIYYGESREDFRNNMLGYYPAILEKIQNDRENPVLLQTTSA